MAEGRVVEIRSAKDLIVYHTVEAGDTILVPISTEPKFRTMPMLRDIATILTGFALPFVTIVALLK
ncbi:MAG: hypothetical protein WCO26_25740 [Deltaproteobacteria bacterium]